MLRIPCVCVHKYKYWEDNLLPFQISKSIPTLGSVTPLAIEFWSSLQYQFFLWKKKILKSNRVHSRTYSEGNTPAFPIV